MYIRIAHTSHSYFLRADNVCVAQNNHSEEPSNLTAAVLQMLKK